MSTKRQATNEELEAFGLTGERDDLGETSEDATGDGHDLGDGGSRRVPGADPAPSSSRPSGVRRTAQAVNKRTKQTGEIELLSPRWDTRDAREVGYFVVREEDVGRHRCFNRLTGYEHVTYGTVPEVDECVERQSRAWAEKLKAPSSISPWRAGTAFGKAKQAS